MLSRRDVLRAMQAAPVLLTVTGRQAFAQSDEPIRIGVPLPLTGGLANLGEQERLGIQLAVDNANAAGGVLGRKIELIIVDTKGEPNTAAAVTVKMATTDNVFAFVGGMGSTPDFAMLQAVKRYSPLFVLTGSVATTIEDTFGPEGWFFHDLIWDYSRQASFELFFPTLNPKPTKIAMAYEDGQSGTSSSKNAVAGFAGKYDLVMNEPFKTGSADLSSILVRMKAADPDIFLFSGYAGDYLLLRRQQKELEAFAKMTIIYGTGQGPEEFGDSGQYMVTTDIWSASLNVPGLADWVKDAEAKLGRKMQVYTVVGYTGMQSLIEAIKQVGELDRNKVIDALGTITFDSPFGPIKYSASRKGQHQLLNENHMIFKQFIDGKEFVISPANVASAQPVYPVDNKNQKT